MWLKAITHSMYAGQPDVVLNAAYWNVVQHSQPPCIRWVDQATYRVPRAPPERPLASGRRRVTRRRPAPAARSSVDRIQSR